MARKRKLAAILFSLGCLQGGSVWALGLGEMNLKSFLNEPLKATVPLLNTGDLQEDQIRVRLATSEDFDRLGVDRAYFLTGIKFDVRVDDNGRGRIVLTSDDPVLEPYLDLIIETRWPSGRLLREYTVLVDPPAFDQGAEVVSASERVETVEGIPAPAKKKTEPAAGSGTRVDVGEQSGLGPGQMPERDFSAATARAPSPGSQYMIRRDETLWHIAEAARPEGATVHQTMLDIQRLNPDAFIGGNINRIKAGYIIYLPAASEIGSADVAEALAEVRQQNADWRAGRDSSPAGGAGPSLRISADPVETGAPAGSGDDSAAATGQSAANTAALESLERAELENAELEQRLDSLAEQVRTLEDIVSVKDEQIAALQNALREAEAGAPVSGAAGPGLVDNESNNESNNDSGSETGQSSASDSASAPEPVAGAASTSAAADADENAAGASATGDPVQPDAQPNPGADATPGSRSEPAAEAESHWASNLLYPLVAVLLALLAGLFFWRRRQAQQSGDEEFEPDVFAGVELREQELQVDEGRDGREVEAQADTPVYSKADSQSDSQADTQADTQAAPQTPPPVATPAGVDQPPAQARGGYGERKHDQYASDVDTGDALAEADIYIAYGRHPQAIELLRNAIAAEPGNGAYHLKLLELYAQVGREPEAREQLDTLKSLGDAALVARGEAVLSELHTGEIDSGEQWLSSGESESSETAFAAPTVGNPAGASPIDTGAPTDFETAPEFEPPGEDLGGDADGGFSELEIEDDRFDDLDDDLDLSRDFESSEVGDEDDEDLVFATEGNPMSTKLDLARAYIDMGDEEGARQILDEVQVGGSEEQQQEAQALLERLG